MILAACLGSSSTVAQGHSAIYTFLAFSSQFEFMLQRLQGPRQQESAGKWRWLLCLQLSESTDLDPLGLDLCLTRLGLGGDVPPRGVPVHKGAECAFKGT